MKRRKGHPCSAWCEEQLKSIVENLRLRGEVDDDFQIEFIALRGWLVFVPKGTYTLKCRHGREWMLREVEGPVPG